MFSHSCCCSVVNSPTLGQLLTRERPDELVGSDARPAHEGDQRDGQSQVVGTSGMGGLDR